MKLTGKIILALAVAIILVLLTWALWPAPLAVSAVVAERGPFQEIVEEEGRTVLRNPYHVSAPIGGYLQRVEVESGDTISAGEVLFRLEGDPVPALDSRTRRQANEAVGAAESRLAAAEAERQAREAELDRTEREFARAERLAEEDAVAEAQFDFARAERDRARALEKSAREAVEVARFELRNARSILEVTQGERSGTAESILEVRAPRGGIVLRRHRWSEGPVQAGEPILDLGDFSDLEVQVDLLSIDAVRIRESMRVFLTRWGGDRDLPARVRLVEPAGFTRVSALGVEEQRVPVRITVDAPREDWLSLGEGYRVEARFVLWEDEDVLQIPASALFREDDAWAVFTVEQGRATLNRVQPGRRSGLWSQILAGLEPGAMVITHPGDRVVDGKRVEAEVQRYR